MPNYIPFETAPETAQWNRTITRADYTKMLQGHIPQAMEDKWNIKTDEPKSGSGNYIVHIYLGWTPREEIALEVAVGDSDEPEAKDWATIVKIAWRAEHPGGIKVSENEAKIRAIRLCNNLLGCGLEEEEEEEEEEDEIEAEDKGS